MRRLVIVSALAVALSTLNGVSPPAAQATEYTKVVRYGPFTIPAATDAGPGRIHNKLEFAVRRPCIGC